MNELRAQHGLPLREFKNTYNFDPEDLKLVKENWKEQEIITLPVIQQAIIDRCKLFVKQEIDREIRKQEEDVYEQEYWQDREELMANTRGNSFNDNLDTDQQSQDFWDDLENQAYENGDKGY